MTNALACIPLERVDIASNELISQSSASRLTIRYLDRCIDKRLVKEILTEVSTSLIEQGYVTTRPYLTEQDINDGQLEIRILEGRIEDIVYADSGLRDGRIKTAFMFNEAILNLRELESSLEIMERVSSVEASFQILPGREQGGSIVQIQMRQSNPVHVALGVNAQTELDPQLSLEAIWDNPFEINDILELRYNSGEIANRYQSNRSGELQYSLPLGRWLLSLGHGEVSFEQRVQGIGDSFLSEGSTVSDELEVSKLLTRSQNGKLNLAVRLELKDSKSYFEGQLIEVSSYKTSELQVRLRHDWLQNWGQLSTEYQYHRGLDSFGARDDGYFTLLSGDATEARLQFEKQLLELQLNYLLPRPDWQLRLRLYWQYSADVLFDDNKVYLGSPYNLRGYASALSGSNAGYLRTDLVHNFQAVVNPFSGKAFTKNLSLSLGIDYGDVKCESDNLDVCGDITGLGAELLLADNNFQGRLMWGYPLEELDNGIGTDSIFLLEIRWLI